MTRKSRTKLQLTPEMAAKDAYRWQLCKDNNIDPHRMCYWFAYIQSSKFPSKKERDNKYQTRYKAHTIKLKEAYDTDTSLFKLGITDTMGLGVFAREDIKVIRVDSSNVTTMLQAEYQNLIEKQDWLIGIVRTKNNTNGRPKKIRGASKRLKSMKKEGIMRSMVGPFDFVNHACDEHLQFNWEEDSLQQYVVAVPKSNKHVGEGDEIFINYKDGFVDSEADYECMFCKELLANWTANT